MECGEKALKSRQKADGSKKIVNGIYE